MADVYPIVGVAGTSNFPMRRALSAQWDVGTAQVLVHSNAPNAMISLI